MQILGRLASPADIECFYRAQRHAALFVPELVLKDPNPRTALTNANAKSRNVIIELDVITLAGRQRERTNNGRCELHCPHAGKTMGRSGKPATDRWLPALQLVMVSFRDLQATTTVNDGRLPGFQQICKPLVGGSNPSPGTSL